jgi:WhiB family redox-sensing transcriptional regulator
MSSGGDRRRCSQFAGGAVDDVGMGSAATSTTSTARCYDPTWTNAALFFSEQPIDIARAKVICVGCELRQQCLVGALERREPVGVWGGECFFNGRVVETRRGRGRPRKHPLAASIEVLDEVPTPGTTSLAG